MSKTRFSICSPEIPPMLGRSQIMEQLFAELTKPTPSHRSVVGPRFSGKSVILKNLAVEMRAGTTPYCCVIEWDLGHQTPRTDQEFLVQLCERLADGLNLAGQNLYGNHLKEVKEGHYSEICEVVDSLESEGSKVLMIWDGFDKPLSTGTLTRNLWDNLRELCLKTNFRIVIATRRELHDLIRDEKSVTSDFWNIFGDVVRIGVFNEQDIDAVLATLAVYTFQPGAKTELLNWSGGSAPLLLTILNEICNVNSAEVITNEAVNKAGNAVLDLAGPILEDLWQDCSLSAQDLYTVLAERGESTISSTTKEDRQELHSRGFVTISAQKISSSCRLLERHIQGTGPDAGSMARLFGNWEAYQSNIRGFLERRLSYLNRFDDRLFRLVARAIEDIPCYPNDCLNNLTGIEERALDIVCQREFGAERRVPQTIVNYWTEDLSPRSKDKMVKERMSNDDWAVSSDRLKQLRFLQLLTGSQNDFAPKARCTSKDTYVLLNAIHSYRNRNQHSDGQEMHLGVAVAAMITCIELLACLDRDTPTSQ